MMAVVSGEPAVVPPGRDYGEAGSKQWPVGRGCVDHGENVDKEKHRDWA